MRPKIRKGMGGELYLSPTAYGCVLLPAQRASHSPSQGQRPWKAAHQTIERAEGPAILLNRCQGRFEWSPRWGLCCVGDRDQGLQPWLNEWLARWAERGAANSHGRGSCIFPVHPPGIGNAHSRVYSQGTGSEPRTSLADSHVPSTLHGTVSSCTTAFSAMATCW